MTIISNYSREMALRHFQNDDTSLDNTFTDADALVNHFVSSINALLAKDDEAIIKAELNLILDDFAFFLQEKKSKGSLLIMVLSVFKNCKINGSCNALYIILASQFIGNLMISIGESNLSPMVVVFTLLRHVDIGKLKRFMAKQTICAFLNDAMVALSSLRQDATRIRLTFVLLQTWHKIYFDGWQDEMHFFDQLCKQPLFSEFVFDLCKKIPESNNIETIQHMNLDCLIFFIDLMANNVTVAPPMKKQLATALHDFMHPNNQWLWRNTDDSGRSRVIQLMVRVVNLPDDPTRAQGTSSSGVQPESFNGVQAQGDSSSGANKRKQPAVQAQGTSLSDANKRKQPALQAQGAPSCDSITELPAGNDALLMLWAAANFNTETGRHVAGSVVSQIEVEPNN